MISKNVMRRMSKYIELAKALRNNKQTGQCFHICVVVYKRKILAIGINNYRRTVNRTSWGRYKVYGAPSYIPSLHAEMSALLKLGLEDCSHLDFYNIRINRNDEIAPSAPCMNCMNMLNAVGFKNIYYIDKLLNINTVSSYISLNTDSDYDKDTSSIDYGNKYRFINKHCRG